MNPREEFHEKEVIVLQAPTPIKRADLHKYLCSIGIKSEDDFYYLDRPDKPAPWQAISVFDIEVLLGGKTIYETTEDVEETGGGVWDRLEVSYLLASLPEAFINIYCKHVFMVAEHFGLRVIYHGKEVADLELRRLLLGYATNLKKDYAEPGSELLAILIQETYPQ